jgi:hypothetical protein
VSARPRSVGASFEVHTHRFVRGPRRDARYGRDGTWQDATFAHAHDDGSRAHGHPDTGPACFTIDRDAWFRTTGLRGGGRKTFTTRPTGEQFPIEELEDWQKTFEVRIVGAPTPQFGTGPGLAHAARMALTFKIRPIITDERPRRRRRATR